MTVNVSAYRHSVLFSRHAAIMMMEKQVPSFSATYVETCVLTVTGFCIYIAVLIYTRDRWEIFHSFMAFSKLYTVVRGCPVQSFVKECAEVLLFSHFQSIFCYLYV
jgi:hypothetical protein